MILALFSNRPSEYATPDEPARGLVDALAQCGARRCGFVGVVPTWDSDGAFRTWECPRCGIEHEEVRR